MKNYLDMIPAGKPKDASDGMIVKACDLCDGAMRSKAKLVILLIDENNKAHRYTANVSYGEAYLMLSQEMQRVMGEISK